MNCEIEFLAVGEGSKAGDAILVRYGYDYNYELMLVDGGFTETGETIVNHLRNLYGLTPHLSHVVLTHSDADHASGLRTVLSEISVGALWINLPWNHISDAMDLFHGNYTVAGLHEYLRTEYDILAEIEDIAQARGIPIYAAMQGTQIGPFTVLSPDESTYQYLMAQFDRTPEPNRQAIANRRMWIGKATRNQPSWVRFLSEAAAAVANWLPESLQLEQLRDGLETSASNESSVVLYAEFDGDNRVLLTGDAGVSALTWAADYADARGFTLGDFRFVQIPHHGSRHNVGPTILNRLIGNPQQLPIRTKLSAFVSAPKDDATHPRKIVVNAFIRRGAQVGATQGKHIVSWIGLTPRAGYVSLSTLELSSLVEPYD